MDMDVIIDGTQYAITQMPGTDLMWLIYMLVFVPEDNYTLNMGGDNIFVFEKKGIYVMGSSWESIKLTFANPIGELKTLDEKFIPDTIARISDIETATTLTSPNGTKYRLTVSDDGTLSATPVATE